MIAVRTNERAAAALGISVSGAKLYAFGLSAAIAALGGILLAFMLPTIDYTSFTNFTSLVNVGLATLGGLGYIMGPVIGATMSSGGLDQQNPQRPVRRDRQVHPPHQRHRDPCHHPREPGRGGPRNPGAGAVGRREDRQARSARPRRPPR